MNNENNNFGNQMPNNNQNMNMQNQPSMGSQTMNQRINPQVQTQPQIMNQQINPQVQTQPQTMNQQINPQVQTQPQTMNQPSVQQFQPVQNYNLNNQPNNGKKMEKTVLWLIIAASVFAVATIVLIVVILIGDKKGETKNVNEYEESTNNTENNVINTGNENTTSSETYTYSGFEFNKVSGYQYSVEDDMLVVQNSNYMIAFTAIETGFSSIKASETEFTSELNKQFTNEGFVSSNLGIQTIDGIDIYTGNLSRDNINASYFIVAADSTHSFTGMAINRGNTFDQENLIQTLAIVKGAKNVGGYDSYSKSFTFDKEIDFNAFE